MEQNKDLMSVTFKEEKQREVEENFEFFQSILPELLKPHFGKTALLRHQKTVASSIRHRTCIPPEKRFTREACSPFRKVDPRPIDLGIYSRF